MERRVVDDDAEPSKDPASKMREVFCNMFLLYGWLG